ncbi:hypothetical protein [Caldibacillus debilis]|uniref:hypothetical protein n=1 Tax=Caldibacillus debilis TaxID=301148 RepID=UPI0023EFDD0C|nr:hypothetical protein [Caldibacillus debilis]
MINKTVPIAARSVLWMIGRCHTGFIKVFQSAIPVRPAERPLSADRPDRKPDAFSQRNGKKPPFAVQIPFSDGGRESRKSVDRFSALLYNSIGICFYV